MANFEKGGACSQDSLTTLIHFIHSLVLCLLIREFNIQYIILNNTEGQISSHYNCGVILKFTQLSEVASPLLLLEAYRISGLNMKSCGTTSIMNITVTANSDALLYAVQMLQIWHGHWETISYANPIALICGKRCYSCEFVWTTSSFLLGTC